MGLQACLAQRSAWHAPSCLRGSWCYKQERRSPVGEEPGSLDFGVDRERELAS